MAAAPQESLPCAAPTPLPPLRCWSPDPEMGLTPERGGSGRPAGGILRRRQQQQQQEEKPASRHVRFRIGSKCEELRGLSDLAGPTEEPRGPARMAREEPQAGPAALHKLGSPIPHSSLALGAEVQAAREQDFDARQAAEDRIQRSFVARCAAEAHVGEGLNIRRDQQLYQGLISLQVPADELLHLAVQEKLALVQYHPGGRKGADCAGPDLMAFYRPEEQFTETPFLDVEGLPPLKLQARRRDPATTFLMYRKLQQWAT